MAVQANDTTFLLLGFIFMMSKYSVVVADSSKLTSEPGGHPKLKPNQYSICIRKIDYKTSTATETANTPTESGENYSPVLQRRRVLISNGFFSHALGTASSRVDIDMRDLSIRARHPKKELIVSVIDGTVYVGGKVVCDSMNGKLSKATYQKSSDGAYWYTNIKIGEPMTQAEVDEFEKEWAQHEKERKEWMRQREAEKERRCKEREEEKKKYRHQKETERKQRKGELERQRKESIEKRERQSKGRKEKQERELNERKETQEIKHEKFYEERRKAGAKGSPHNGKIVTNTRGGRRPKEVNMHNPFRSDFVVGVTDDYMINGKDSIRHLTLFPKSSEK